ncbi:hypothetical protein [[Phormidium] sp. ETS-05]|nr:hypothetical protein [[Phormidium] sp. ETS-05]
MTKTRGRVLPLGKIFFSPPLVLSYRFAIVVSWWSSGKLPTSGS